MSLGQVTTGFLVGNVGAKLSTLMHSYPPTEVIFNPKRVDKEIINAIKNSVWAPRLMKLSPRKKFKCWRTFEIFENVRDALNLKKKSEVLKGFDLVINQFGKGKFSLSKSLGGLFNFLQYNKSLDLFLDNFNLDFFEEQGSIGKNMIIDATTLENLEILSHVTHDAGKGNICLFDSLNKCVSSPGKRLLRKWIASPLLDPVQIS